jgi:SAM-dependent methyltransferase
MIQSAQFDLYQAFVQEGRKFWKNDLYQDVMAAASEAGSLEDLEADRRLQAYSWFEKNLQLLKYYGPQGLIETFHRTVSRQAAEIEQAFELDAAAVAAWNDELPAYYRDTSFHQHAPGVWPSIADALSYEFATNFYSFSLEAADVPYRKVAEKVAELIGDRPDPSVLDIGTGYGKLAFVTKRMHPEWTVAGMDLSIPLIKLGRRRAAERGLDVDLFWHKAEEVHTLGRQFDVITGYWLLHELPQDVIREVARSCFQALKPGGWLLSLDMHRATGGALGALLQKRHGRGNDEPFMEGLLEWDYQADLAKIGFTDIALLDAETGLPFDSQRPLPQRQRKHEFSMLIARCPQA